MIDQPIGFSGIQIFCDPWSRKIFISGEFSLLWLILNRVVQEHEKDTPVFPSLWRKPIVSAGNRHAWFDHFQDFSANRELFLELSISSQLKLGMESLESVVNLNILVSLPRAASAQPTIYKTVKITIHYCLHPWGFNTCT